ncbi:hypothetical protein Poli38472_009855 [Pythium oligandrum]|uniref:Protein kinase domain-containing protein n=1 Tax=Pythium oligandrum TaxID=41045 RepID=A0A8K1CFH3_PYTOL|nr:hypothetical protein Poli38472_009855 [Pythium oligandrum]|eukprot:TMW62362.1 hypothetical protein Poli38472_009855 [Pythium oligandrum]
MASSITSVGFIGSGRLAEGIARNLIKKITPQRRFCYKKQRLVSTLLASDPSEERRQVFDGLGFTTTVQNHEVISECDVVFIGTNAREALTKAGFAQYAKRSMTLQEQLKNTLFVSLMGDLPAEQVERLIYPGAKVIRMMPQSYLEQKGLANDLLPPKAWATVRNNHVSAEDVQKVMELAGISTSVEINDQHPDLWAFNIGSSLDYDDEVPAETGHDHCTADFHDAYTVGEYIGKGRFAEVFQTTHNSTGETYAVKCASNSALDKDAKDALIAEVGALNRLTHPNIITHHGFYAEDDKYYLVLDHCKHGSVRRLIRNHEGVPEALAKSIMRQLLEAIAYCHSMGHVHRDIKAENVLLAEDPTKANDYAVKLADFGLSKELDLVSHQLQDVCGTPQYLSPEIVSGRTYGKPVDVWSAGILGYMLLSGQAPFEEAGSEEELNQLIRIGAIYYHQPVWRTVSKEAADFVQRMLDLSPDSRATAEELLQHKWLQP